MSCKTHEALLSLGRNPDDKDAMLAIYEENRDTIRAAFRRWVVDRKHQNLVEAGVMMHILKVARFYDPTMDSPEDWVFQHANQYCLEFRVDLESKAAWRN